MSAVMTYFARLRSFAGLSLWLNLAGMVLVSLFAGAGTLLLIPLLNMTGLAQVSVNIPLLSQLSRLLADIPLSIGLAIVLAAYALIMISQNLLQRGVSIRNAKLMNDFGRELRLETYEGVLRADWSFFLSKRKSDLLNSLTQELARVMHGSHLVLQLIASTVFTAIQVGIAFWFAAEITGFVLLCGILLAVFSQKYIKRAKELGSRTSKLGQSYLGELTDQLNGMKEIKSNNLGGYRWNWFQKITEDMVKEQIGYIKLKTGTDFFYKLASTLFLIGFIYTSVTFFHTRLDQLLIVIVIFARLWPVFTGLQSTAQQLAASLPAFLSVRQLQRECRRAAEPMENNAVPALQLHTGIECRGVSFRYDTSGEESFALQDIHLHIPAKGMTAIVGRSGAGKSTLIDVLMGLVRPARGEVQIDGVRLQDVPISSLRNAISYVPQDPYLFNGTIRENLLMAAPEATEVDMWQALTLASAAAFVRQLPQGIHTEIGDRGIRLSGGERQRIVLARALLRQPSILVLDEATSALDAENERSIQESLERLKGRMTIIVIAHRLTTIRNADQVIVLDKGKIVQRGAFSQLVDDSEGVFNHLLGTQMKVAL